MDNTEVYPDWIDLAWLAVDSSGELAVLTTGGEGPVPSTLLWTVPPDAGPYTEPTAESGIALTEDLILTFPIHCRAMADVNCGERDPFAARGFYAYDWINANRRTIGPSVYVRVASPEVPLHVTNVPATLRDRIVQLSECAVLFRECKRIDVLQYVKCVRHSA